MQTYSTPSELLERVFGFTSFRDQQEHIIGQVLDGGDALVVMPTGSGKSLCFQIPAILRPGTGLVVSPLIALMEDQVVALEQIGVRAACLHSGQGESEARHVWRQLHEGKLDLLYVSPERLLSNGFLDRVTNVGISLFAIDEAHCVSMWGHDFRPEYLGLAVLAERFPGVPRIALTATADPPTRKEIATKLDLENARCYLSSFDRPNIRYRVYPKNNPRKQLLDLLREEHRKDSGIVYCLSRKKVEQTAEWLCAEGFDALPYHAGLDSNLRRKTQRRFVNDEVAIIVATVAFGMGIDKPDVRFVAHLDLPKSFEAYYQETGRGGRDGLPATALMVYGLQDIAQLRRFIEEGDSGPDRQRVEHLKLNALLGYCETTRCRRQVLLEYFGEIAPAACGNCDACLEPVATWDGTEAAQMTLSAVYRTGQRFGSAHVIDVLLGDETPKVIRNSHQDLPTFGVGSAIDRRTWQSVMRQLVAAGLLQVDIDGYGALRLGPDSRAVLRGEQPVPLRHDPLKPKKTRDRKKKSLALENLVLTEDDEQLFETLREKRFEMAKDQKVPPYVIFSDRSLIEMAAKRPSNQKEILDIHGVGDVKFARYGETFLGLISEHSIA
jgi:ATP-dependent DNA helicase RecQ